MGTPSHPLQADEPGIGQITLAGGTRVSFAGLQSLGNTNGTGDTGDWKRTHITPPPNIDPSHDNIGYFDFVQAGTESVFFGEWSQTGEEGDSSYAVYYAGTAGDVVNTLPTQTATYTVVGINQGNALNGTLTATFGGDNILAGNLFNSTLSLDILANIDPSDASFSGAAFANIGNGQVAGGSEGHFFGDAAAALAGLAIFDDLSLNTAFGGTKDP